MSKSLAERGITLDTIKAWRAAQHAAGLPSGLNDFFVAHNLCLLCHGRGANLVWGSSDNQPLGEEICYRCGGTGQHVNSKESDHA